MATIDFKFGTLIRTGPKLQYGGKWNADLVDWRVLVLGSNCSQYLFPHFRRVRNVVFVPGPRLVFRVGPLYDFKLDAPLLD